MQVNIVGGSYRGEFIDMNPQKTINYYIQKDMLADEDSKYKQALLPFPGLSINLKTTYQTIHRQFVARTINFTRWFAVADNDFIEVFENGSYMYLGSVAQLLTGESPIWIECNANNQVFIASASAGYYFDMVTNILLQITDVNFPGGADYVSYTEEYMIVTYQGRVYYNLNDVSTWDAENVFTPGAHANKLLAAIVWRDDIHCFCEESIELYVNDGVSPFSKQDRSTINLGLVSATCLGMYHDGILFVSRNRKGGYQVYFYNGIIATPVSTQGVTWQLTNPLVVFGASWQNLNIQTWDVWESVWGITLNNMYSEIQYTRDGHIFYYVTIPFLNTTYVFDVQTKEWVERQSFNPAVQQDQAFRGVNLVAFNDSFYWTDLYSGNILKEDYTVATEVNNTITRTRVSEVYSKEKKNVSMYDFELDCSTGIGLLTNPSTPANIMFYYSRDGGKTYNNGISLSTGSQGQNNIRQRIRKLGTARNWVFKIVQTDPAYLMVQSAMMSGVLDTY